MKKNYLLIVLFIYSVNSFAQLEYKDVASIFFAKCASCHNANGIANSDFTNYAGTAPYANTISNYIHNNIMPPWPPDTSYTRFVHERTISATEKAAILQWISDGVLAGNLTQVPSPPTFPATQLQGVPDKILQIPTYTSTASGADKYVCFSLPIGITQNRFLRAYEIIPGNPDIVHHVVVNVDTTGNYVSNLSGSCFNMPSNSFSIGDFAPGAAPQIFPGVAPVKFGIEIKAGSNLILQMHYPAGSAGQVDSTQIRLYFYPPAETGIRPLYNTVALQNWSFSIAANTTQTVTAKYPAIGGLLWPVSVYSVFPHSHQICTSIENYAMNGTSKIKLINIPKWNFHWQGFYTYKKMVKLPSGSVIHGSHVFDNTTNNPNNPANPNPVTVQAGPFTNDEMVFDGLMWAVYLPGDENVDIEAILAVDPLLSIKNPPNIKLKTPVTTFPNPFSNEVNISFSLNKPEQVSINIYNILGERINTIIPKTELSGYVKKTWDGANQNGFKVNPGVYIYEVLIGEEKITGKIVLNP